MTQAAGRLVEILNCRSNKSVGVLGIDFRRRFANDVAVEEGHWLAEGDSADDEGDKEERVDACHDEEAEIGLRPVVAYADHDVEGCYACLGMLGVCSEVVVEGCTYHAQCTNEFLGWFNTGCDDHLDEVGANADDQDHADSLEDAGTKEHLAQRHGVVAWDRHIGGLRLFVVKWMWLRIG